MVLAFVIVFLIQFDCLCYSPVQSETIQLNAGNIDGILAKYELVFINFYVGWCRYSNLMQPIFDDAARLVNEEFGSSGRVAMCKVDCDTELDIAKRFQITKYPTLKVSLNGDVMKREYRGQRSSDALVEYVREQMKDPIKEITDLNELKHLDGKKRMIIAYFDRKLTPEYNIYRKVAANLKEDCGFFAGFGESVSGVHAGDKPTIIFKPDVELSHDQDEVYQGKIHPDELKIWAQEKCIPLVREITFDNAEELTEEGMPFMILFYHPNNTHPIKDYKAKVEAELISEKQNINFLIADGKRFAHPLQHLDKTMEDLPVIAIDSFRHMYLFPDYNDIHKPGKLKNFVADLHSGKLHREFHYGPDPELIDAPVEQHEHEHEQEHQSAESSNSNENRIDEDVDASSPPDSTFIKLAPSEKRYTLIRNEL